MAAKVQSAKKVQSGVFCAMIYDMTIVVMLQNSCAAWSHHRFGGIIIIIAINHPGQWSLQLSAQTGYDNVVCCCRKQGCRLGLHICTFIK